MFGVTISSGVAVLVAAVFLACAVEMVEALTIVLAVGHTRGWRSAFEGVAVALGVTPGRDRVAFVMSFKGVFLEGLEVVVTVLTLGTSAHRLGLAATTALVALVLVAGVGVAVARQLSKVPENAMKMSVGVMLVSYGTFWVGEGLRVRWPGTDAFLLVCVVFYAVATAVLVGAARRSSSAVAR